MKRTRVIISSCALAALVGFICFVPVPTSRIRARALVQAHPEHSSQVMLKRSALLEKLLVRPGDRVTKDSELAVFRDPDLEEKLAQARAELENANDLIGRLQKQKSETNDPRERARIEDQILQAAGKRDTAIETVGSLLKVQKDELVIRAPRDGVVGQAPRVEDVGKMFEGRDAQQMQPIFTVHEPGQLRVCLPLVTSEYHRLAKDWEERLAKSRENGEEVEQPWINLRVHGMDSQTWRGKIERLEDSEAKYIPEMLSTRANGPVAVQAPNGRTPGLVPQTQHYLVYLKIDNPDDAIAVGAMSQVKIYLKSETCLNWAWRSINDLVNLKLI